MTQCKDLFDNLVSLVEDRSNKPASGIACTLSSNQSDGIVSYATGRLQLIPAVTANPNAPSEGPAFLHQPARLEGELEQVISDRVRMTPVPGSDFSGQNLFDAQKADRLKISITTEKFDDEKLLVTITWLTWGETSFTFSPQCVGGLLIGMGDPVGRNALQAFYTISFRY